MITPGVRYAVWQDYRTKDYEVVRWEGREHLVVETNLKTMERAEAARRRWAKREEDKHG